MPMTKIQFGVTHGLRGWFAIMYDDEGPIQSGIGSYDTPAEAWKEAAEWADSEGYPVQAEMCMMQYYNRRTTL